MARGAWLEEIVVMPDHPLKHAYETTAYWVEDRFAIRCQARSAALDALLGERGHDTWAYLTASNPGSVILDDATNALRMAELARRLEELGHPFLAGQGVGAAGDWPPEPSLLVLGIGENAALEIGRAFGQVAIVVGRRGEPAALRFCMPPTA